MKREQANTYSLREETRRFFCFMAALLYKRGVRKLFYRRYKNIILKSRPQILIVLFELAMMHNGMNLIASGGNGAISNPRVFGSALVVLAVMGFFSIGARQSGLQAAFAAGSFVVRFLMAMMYLIHDWRGEIWGGYLIASLACVWMFSRVSCDAAAKRPFRILGLYSKLGIKSRLCNSRNRVFDRA